MQKGCKMGEYERQIVEFFKSILYYFSLEISNSWLATANYLILDLDYETEWESGELDHLKVICRNKTKEYKTLLDTLEIDQDFLIKVLPHNKIRIQWYKKDIN